MNEIQYRWNAPTPPFFKKLQYLGMVLGAVGGTIMAAPLALPAALVSAAGYMLLGGSVLAAVSQVAVDQRPSSEIKGEHREEIPNMPDYYALIEGY